MNSALALPPIDSFWSEMRTVGLAPQGSPIADGELHRFTVEGDRPGSKNGWYVLYGDGLPAGSFGSWKTNEQHSWCAKPLNTLTRPERQRFTQQRDTMNKARETERRATQQLAAIQCGELWSSAKPLVSANHYYLVSKQIRAYGLRQLNQMLLVPIQDAQGRLVSLQFITPDGAKRFKSGGRIKGCYTAIGTLTKSAFICEGYATGATIHQATGQSVVVAFSAGNLSPVIASLNITRPRTRLMIAADNDRCGLVNAGLEKAQEAAHAFGLPMVYPTFIDEQPGSDFNDLAALVGLDKVATQLSLHYSEVA